MAHLLDTARLRLRTLAQGDAAFYLELVNEPAFIDAIGERGIRTLLAARRAIVDGPMAMHRALGHALCLVELKHDATPIGICGLIKRDTLPGVDIGYAIPARYSGQGYATEAAPCWRMRRRVASSACWRSRPLTTPARTRCCATSACASRQSSTWPQTTLARCCMRLTARQPELVLCLWCCGRLNRAALYEKETAKAATE